MENLSFLTDPIFLNSIFRFVAPILFAALGGMLCTHVGITNIALEGFIVMGCFGAVLGSYFLKSAFLGVITGVLFSVLVSLLYAFLKVSFGADEVVVGLALNLFCSSMTVFLLRSIFKVTGSFTSPDLKGLGIINIPFIRSIPIVGPLFSGHTALIYISWLFVFLTYILLYRTAFGLRMRGVGEHSEASSTLGVNVHKTKYIAILLSGVLCGLAGAQLSLGNVTMFVEDMSSGRGWIAIVANLLGQSLPLGVFLSSLLFGFVTSLSFRFQGLGWASELTEMLPYIITIISLVLVYIFSDKKMKRPSKEILAYKNEQMNHRTDG